MSRAPKPGVVLARAAAGYLTPAAIVEKYGAKHDFGIKLVYKWRTAWGNRGERFKGRPVVVVDGSNVWLLEAAVVAMLKKRDGL